MLNEAKNKDQSAKIANTNITLILDEEEDDFSKNIIGMKIDELKKFTAKIPTIHFGDQFAGKEAKFTVILTNIYTLDVPIIDDEYSKINGFKSLENMQESVKSELINEITYMSQFIVNKRIAQCINKLDIALPNCLVTKEQESLKRNSKQVNIDDEIIIANAQNRIKIGLVIGSVCNKNNIKVRDEEIIKYLVEMSPLKDEAFIKQYVENICKNQATKSSVQADILEKKAFIWITGQLNTTEEKMSFTELKTMYNEATL